MLGWVSWHRYSSVGELRSAEEQPRPRACLSSDMLACETKLSKKLTFTQDLTQDLGAECLDSAIVQGAERGCRFQKAVNHTQEPPIGSKPTKPPSSPQPTNSLHCAQCVHTCEPASPHGPASVHSLTNSPHPEVHSEDANLGKKPVQVLAVGWGLWGAWGKFWGAWSLVWVMPSTCYIVWVDLSPGPQGLFSPGGWPTAQERQS